MLRCYLLIACSGSSLDQQSNNFSHFNVIEQVNLPASVPRGQRVVLPIEIHSYWRLETEDLGRDLEIRYALVAPTALETLSDPFRWKSATRRFRARSFGLPLPPVLGEYELRADWRHVGDAVWRRDPSSWPLLFAESKPVASVTN